MTGILVAFGQRLATTLTGGNRWAWLPHLLLWCSLKGGAATGALARYRLGSVALWPSMLACVVLAIYAATIRPNEDSDAR